MLDAIADIRFFYRGLRKRGGGLSQSAIQIVPEILAVLDADGKAQ